MRTSFFPFKKIRPGQKEFLNDVNLCLANKKILLAHAPTGIGKTAAVLAPALKYALDNEKIIFFLTPRHSQHLLAIETLKMIKNSSDEDFIAVDLIGKKWLCPVPYIDKLSNSDFAEYCKIMRKDKKCVFYKNTTKDGKLRKKARNVIRNLKIKQPLHTEDVYYYCKDERLCPYELTMRMAKEANVIVADYFHIFSSASAPILENIEKPLSDIILVIDEAHNLPNRIRSLLTLKLSSFLLRAAMKEAEEFEAPIIKENLQELEKVITKLAGRSDEEAYIKKDAFIKLVEEIDDYYSLIEKFHVAGNEIREEKKKSFIGSVGNFLERWLGDDLGYTRIITKTDNKIVLTYSCLDPSIISKDIFNDVHSAILMSGTLKPMNMYEDLLGLEKRRTLKKEYHSSFPAKSRLNLILTDVTTKYENRNENEYKKIANYLIRCINTVPGNVAVFFPSYEMRNKIYYTILTASEINKEIILEKKDATKEERKNLIDEFVSYADKGAALFGVIGGSFDQGIDLPGKFLRAVIIVGIPLSKPTLETKAIIDYYDKKFTKGWDYAYIYPAMIKAMQAAGRCIRSETDRGVVIFMDKRYVWGNYKKIFPSDFRAIITKHPDHHIKNFFDSSC